MLRLNKYNLLFICLLSLEVSAQEKKSQEGAIRWMTFEALEMALEEKPRKVLLFFYADWCAYCKKMEQTAFINEDIVEAINNHYYAVKMDVETPRDIEFYGRTYKNLEIGKNRNSTHEIAKLLASRPEKPLTLPAVLILDDSFTVCHRLFSYLSPKELFHLLSS